MKALPLQLWSREVETPFVSKLNELANMKSKLLVILFSLASSLNLSTVTAEMCGEPVLQLGWYIAKQGKSQHIGIQDLIGDDFSVRKSYGQNFLIGAGYFFDCWDTSQMRLQCGINAFYLAPTRVSGHVKQEDLFTNLSYHYSRTNYPIYFATKALVPVCGCYDLTLDLGIGPNIISTGKFKEKSIDGGITNPDKHLFSGNETTVFSAEAGLGFRMENVCECCSLELDYRFFYLGEGKLKRINNQVKNTLHTGNSYAHAIFISVSL